MNIEGYRRLEGRIKEHDLDALLARWECGRLLIEERGDKERLPNGRLEELANALASSRAELKNRIQFAEQYPTEAKVRAAFKEFGSWHAICAGGMGSRSSTTGVPDLLRVELADPASLKRHPKNYKDHPEDQVEQLVKSIEAVGIIRNVVVARDNTILAGHGIVEAARRLGIARVPVKRLDLDPNEPKALKLLTADNEIGDMALRDHRKLTEMLRQLAANDSLEGSGFDSMQLAARLFVSRMRGEVEKFDAAAEMAGLIDYEHGAQVYRLNIKCRTSEDRERFVKQHEIAVTREQSTGKLGTVQTAWWPASPAHDRKSVRWQQRDEGLGECIGATGVERVQR